MVKRKGLESASLRFGLLTSVLPAPARTSSSRKKHELDFPSSAVVISLRGGRYEFNVERAEKGELSSNHAEQESVTERG